MPRSCGASPEPSNVTLHFPGQSRNSGLFFKKAPLQGAQTWHPAGEGRSEKDSERLIFIQNASHFLPRSPLFRLLLTCCHRDRARPLRDLPWFFNFQKIGREGTKRCPGKGGPPPPRGLRRRVSNGDSPPHLPPPPPNPSPPAGAGRELSAGQCCSRGRPGQLPAAGPGLHPRRHPPPPPPPYLAPPLPARPCLPGGRSAPGGPDPAAAGLVVPPPAAQRDPPPGTSPPPPPRRRVAARAGGAVRPAGGAAPLPLRFRPAAATATTAPDGRAPEVPPSPEAAHRQRPPRRHGAGVAFPQPAGRQPRTPRPQVALPVPLPRAQRPEAAEPPAEPQLVPLPRADPRRAALRRAPRPPPPRQGLARVLREGEGGDPAAEASAGPGPRSVGPVVPVPWSLSARRNRRSRGGEGAGRLGPLLQGPLLQGPLPAWRPGAAALPGAFSPSGPFWRRASPGLGWEGADGH